MRKTILMIMLLSIFFADSAYAGVSFLKKIKVVTKDKEDVLVQQRFFSEGDSVRIEEESAGIEGNPGIRLYDFKKKKLYTIMLNVKLYMEQDIGIEKEVIMFEPDPEKRYADDKDVKVVKTKKGEETIQGYHTTIYEVKVIRKGGKDKDKDKGKEKEEQVLEQYSVWRAEGLQDMPVKYEIELHDNNKRIIEYLDIKTDAIEPSLFSIPEGYMAISPY